MVKRKRCLGGTRIALPSRQELRTRAYQRICGIYMLEFDDCSCYIGQSLDIVRRYFEHGRSGSKRVKDHWREHGAPGLILLQRTGPSIYEREAAEAEMIALYSPQLNDAGWNWRTRPARRKKRRR